MPPECQGVTTDQSWNQVLLQGAAVSKNPEDEDDDSGADQINMIIMLNIMIIIRFIMKMIKVKFTCCCPFLIAKSLSMFPGSFNHSCILIIGIIIIILIIPILIIINWYHKVIQFCI